MASLRQSGVRQSAHGDWPIDAMQRGETSRMAGWRRDGGVFEGVTLGMRVLHRDVEVYKLWEWLGGCLVEWVGAFRVIRRGRSRCSAFIEPRSHCRG